MDQYSKKYELKDKAKDCLGGNYGTLILGSFLFSLLIFGVIFVFGFSFFISIAASMYSGVGYSVVSLRIYQVGLILGQVLSGFLNFGVTYLCLKLACGQWGSYTDVFFGFRRENLLKTLLLTSVRLAFNYICLLPGDYLRTNYAQTPDTQLLWMTVLAYIIGCCVYVPVSLALDITYFVLLDFPDRKTYEILRDSFRLIRGNRWRLFLLELSFIPLQLLVFLTLGVGSLWLSPYMYMTYTMFYLDLMHSEKR